ncbi:MAG: NACHT domain-containing protein [Aridibacter sp.]
MSKTNLEKVRQIKDEVKELHPLLDKLFPKMPRYIEMEYTQGNHEMGADFVVARKDDTFGSTEYIGVIAKIGDIKQNFSEVERQIDECSMPRIFRSGKNKIYIDEIWVVFTGTVTNNAKDKIHEKYKARKIKFIDARKLSELIEGLIPSFWEIVSIETGDYLSNLKIKYEELDKSVSLVNVGDERFYIEQDVYTYPREEYRLKLQRLRKPARKVNIFDVINKEKITLIEGQMGAGKSKLLRQIILHFSDSNIYSELKIIPVPVTFREIIDQYDGDIQKLIDSQINSKIKAEMDETVKILLLIDGIDEKKFTNEEQIENLKKICEFTNEQKNLKVVFASRPLEALEKTSDLDKLISSYQLRSLSLGKTIEFLKVICDKLNIKDRLIQDLKKSSLFSELPRSPISIILLANIINENPKDLPSSLTELYTKYVEWTLGRWDIKKGLQSEKEYEALNNIMMNLAKFILDADTASISIDEAKRIFSDYLKPRNLGVNSDELFKILIDRTELMFVNDSNNTIGFKHRTFAEFFYANAAHRDNDMLIDQRAFQPYWMNSFFFYIGLEKDIPEVIKEITSLIPKDDKEEFLKIMNMPNFLMAAYSSPYDVITQGVSNTIIESAKLYEKLVSGKVSIGLSRLPRMHLLWLFQALIRENYSYEFFIPALEHSALSILDEKIDDTTKMYALFFLNVAYIDSGAGKTFDFLLKDFGKSLPLDILLAYDHESKNIKSKNDLMKKQDKRIKKIFGGNRQLSKEVQKLYENPLGTISKQAKKLNM